MATVSHPSRMSLAAAMAAVLVLLGACGGGGGGGPDTSQVEKMFLDQVNLSVDGLARFVEFKETARKPEKDGDFETCQVDFQGEIEFGGNCYFHMKERKKGERLKFDANIEYVKDASGWKQGLAGLQPR